MTRARRRRLELTGEGRFLALMAMGVALAAINTGNNLLYLLFAYLVSMLVASGALSALSLRGLRITRHAPERVVATQPSFVQLAVKNEKRRLPSFSIEIQDVVDGAALGKRCYFLKVPPGREQQTSYRHAFSRRGLHRFDGFQVSTKFPFGLFRKVRFVRMPAEILAYPAIRSVNPPAPRGRPAEDAGAGHRGRRGEFHGLREYREGDDRRDIHWRSSARRDRLVVREFEQQASRRAAIVVDNALPSAGGAAESDALDEAAGLAASLCVAYLASGYAVSLATRGQRIPSGMGPLHRAQLLEALALLEPRGDDAPLVAGDDAGGESVLVAPPGARPPGGPGRFAHVWEAG